MRRRVVLYGALLALGSGVAIPIAAQTSNSAAEQRSRPPPQATAKDGVPSRPLEVKVSSDKPLSIAISGGGPSWKSALIAGLPAAIALFGGLLVVNRSNRQSEKNTKAATDLAISNAQAATNQKANELEIGRIERWLSEFYGPFMQLSEENKRIAEVLRGCQPDSEFRTLKALLDPQWRKAASKTDLNLISRIVGNGIALRTLIRDKGGPVSPALSDYLSTTAAHFTILELADAGAITQNSGDFDQYVYPRQLDPVLKLERERLEARRDVLLAGLSERHPAAPALIIPDDYALDQDAAANAPSSKR